MLLLLLAPLAAGDDLEKKLTDGDVHERIAAAQSLVASPRDRNQVARLLIGARLQERDRKVCFELRRHVAALDERALPALLDNLKHDSSFGWAITTALRRIGKPAVQGVTQRLPSRAAIRALRRMGPAAALAEDRLAKLLDGTKHELDVMFTLAHVAPGHPALLPVVRRYIMSKEAWRRARGAECAALMKTSARPLLPRLLELLDDQDWSVRRGVASALNAIRHLDETVFRAITKRIEGSADAVLFQATLDLLASDKKHAIPFAAKLLKQPYDRKRHGLHRGAVQLLARFEGAAVPYLLNALDRSRAARSEARRQLKKLAPLVVPALVEAVRSGQKSAIPFLGVRGAKEAVSVLIDRLVALVLLAPDIRAPKKRSYTPTPDARELQSVIGALRAIGPPAKIALEKLRNDPDQQLRATAKYILESMR